MVLQGYAMQSRAIMEETGCSRATPAAGGLRIRAWAAAAGGPPIVRTDVASRSQARPTKAVSATASTMTSIASPSRNDRIIESGTPNRALTELTSPRQDRRSLDRPMIPARRAAQGWSRWMASSARSPEAHSQPLRCRPAPRSSVRVLPRMRPAQRRDLAWSRCRRQTESWLVLNQGAPWSAKPRFRTAWPALDLVVRDNLHH